MTEFSLFADPGFLQSRIISGPTRGLDGIVAGDPQLSALHDHCRGHERERDAIHLADAKARLSEPIDRVQAGGSIDITRRGRPVARHATVAARRKPIDVALLRFLTSAMPPPSESAADAVRSEQHGDRY